MKRLLLLIPLILLLLVSKVGEANCGDGYAQAAYHPIVNYNQCTGTLTINRFKFHERNCDDNDPSDALDYLYVDIMQNGNWTTIWRMGRDNFTGAVLNNQYEMTEYVPNYYYGNWNGGNFSYYTTYLTNGNIYTDQSNTNCSSWSFANLSMSSFPQSVMSSGGEIKIRLRGRMQRCNREYHAEFNQVYSFYNYTIASPTNLSASINECGKIKLSWANGIQTNMCSGAGTFDTEVNYSGIATPIATKSYSTLLHEDFFTNPSEKTYSIRTRYKFPNGAYLYSNYVNITGSTSVPSVPTGFALSTSETSCNGNVALNWSGATTSTTIDKWEIYRSNNGGVSFSKVAEVGGTIRLYNDLGLPTNQRYFYVLYAHNCNGYSNYALSDIFVPGKPDLAEPSSTQNYNDLGKIVFNWVSNSSSVTSFEVIRTALGTNSGIEKFDAPATARSYEDLSVASCIPYKYQIRAKNSCSSSGDAISQNFIIDTLLPNLTTAFNQNLIDKKLRVSKGFYPDRIQLEWGNDFQFQIDAYRIERKMANGGTYAIIATASNSSSIYVDNTALPNTVYSYRITGLAQCAGGANSTNTSEDIGFRSPFGIVSGTIAYSGGTAVKGVKVTASSTGAASGTSLLFSGGTNASVTPYSTKINLADSNFTIEFWAKPINLTSSPLGNRNLIDLRDSLSTTKSISIYHNNNKIFLAILNGTTTVKSISTSDTAFKLNTYSQITCTKNRDSMYIYVNGIKQGVISVKGLSSFPIRSCRLELGKNFRGNIDEVRVWKAYKDSEAVTKDFNRFVAPNEANLLGYWSFDENIPNATSFYDQSKQGDIFNETHGTLQSSVQASEIIPGNDLLSNASYTDALGIYYITNIRYPGSGTTYTITPNYTSSGIAHSFSPVNRVEFIGDGSAIKNSFNFIDNNKFDVIVRVKYKDINCPVEGVILKLDNNYPLKGGAFIKTDASGVDTLEVPDGIHTISVEKLDHVFKYSFTTRYFDGPLVLDFEDSTLVKVVGRVVGGNRELNKVAHLGRSKNNIGKARIIFTPTVCSNYSYTIYSDTVTGEYVAKLPPLFYTVLPSIISNPGIKLNLVQGYKNSLDLRVVPQIVNVTDTLKTDTLITVGTAWYHSRLDYPYYTTAEIFLTKPNTPKGTPINNFLGEEYIKINGVNTLIDNNNAFTYPVFLQDKYYSANVNVVEKYINSDNQKVDSVPVSGTLNIIGNGLAIPSDYSLLNILIKDGYYRYGFRAGAPNQLAAPNPDYSYTSTLGISFQPPVGEVVKWFPNKNDPNEKEFRGYVLGARSGGANFTTSGPALVDLILRDPPGTLSYSSWQGGKTRTITTSNSLIEGVESELESSILAGASVTVQVGVPGATVETEAEIDATASLGIKQSYTVNDQGELVERLSSSTTISTSGDPGKVGAGYDLFYGKATNIVFGLSDNLKLIDTTTCRIRTAQNNGNPVCYGKVFNGHQIGLSQGFFMVPGEVKTTFVYTANEIEESIIPSLVDLRNQVLNKGNLNRRNVIKYQSNYTNTGDADYKLKFGSNNDDPVWKQGVSTITPFTIESKDTIGMSYTFRADSLFEVDSVRYFNNQIRLWKNALARNEREKYDIFKDTTVLAESGGRNISIGESSILQDFTSENTQTNSETIELQLGPYASYEIGATVNDFGVANKGSITYVRNTSSTNSNSTSNSTTLSYFLKDGDAGDLISVDIVDGKRGDGHIFRLRAGRTSFPYEDETKAKYFDPYNDTITSTTFINDGVVLSVATAKREVPSIEITPNILYNVPAKEAGVFTLQLGNLSESRQDMTYALRINEASNPFGAILKVDGLDPNREFNVPYGTTSQKTLTVERGPNNYDYNNIQLILKSTCDETIYDTFSISIRFIPTCTSVSMITPDDRWVLNKSFKDTFPIVIGNYNYNFGGFDNVKYQYRPASSSIWINLQKFNKSASNIDTGGKKMLIPIGQPYITYDWFTNGSVTDGNYELRAVSECLAPGYPNAYVYSPVLQGVIDRINPTPFGTPSPADGILDPNDDISIQFNEPIDNSSLTLFNFDVRGVLNGSNLQTNTSLFFDADNDFVELPNGINLSNKSFTIELMAKRGTLGTKQCLLSQGVDANQNFWFGFGADNKLVFRVGNLEVITDIAYTNQTSFSNYAVTYNPTLNLAFIYVNGVVANNTIREMLANYQGAGKVFVGKSSQGNADFFRGNLLELRIWNVARTAAQIQANLRVTLTGREIGILGNWRIDEAEGLSIRDYVRNRTGIITGATWQITPVGRSYSFDGANDYLTTTNSNTAITKEMDFTIEFWVKSNQVGNATLLGNGLGDSTGGGLSWSIDKTENGTLVFKHFGRVFPIVESGLFDNTWHHVSVVMQRNSTLSSYLDGNLQKSYLSSFFNELSGPKLVLGARTSTVINTTTFDNFFNGKLDEVRFWEISKSQELIQRDKLNRLTGKETGLKLYLPFESYYIDQFNVSNLDPTINDIADTSHVSTSFGATFSVETPTIKLPRAVNSIAFTYALNNDKIIITPTIDPAYIENVTLDISVKDIYDLRGNKMQSPKTWIAYINKNQVKWSEDELSFQKVSLSALSFKATINNSGGALKTYNIQNLPIWLTASAPNGTISPNSSKEITFTVNPTVNIGTYEEALSLVTDFGFPEKLIIKLKVYANEPTWAINTDKYPNSMSVIGQLKIGNVISSNTDDILAAFVNGECRGKAKVQYFSSLDKYFVFLDVFGDIDNKEISFKIWNASEGKMHDEVMPNLIFISNDIKGTIASPIVFNADDKLSRIIPLKDGWNWISFNLLTKDSNNINRLFNNLKLEGGEIVRGQTLISDYNVGRGWMGSLANPAAGFKMSNSYRFRSNGVDTLIFSGIEANPLQNVIHAQIGWNWIGFVSQNNIEINEAFGSFTPASGDLMKSQNSFAIYDSIIGWVGSLNTLRPNLGYMYKAINQVDITYPLSGMFGKRAAPKEPELSKRWSVDYNKFSENMNIIAQVDLCKDMQLNGSLLVGAFVNNELRGLSKAVLVNNSFQYFLTVPSNTENEIVEFYLMDENNGKTTKCNETTLFCSNALLGLVNKSLLLSPSNKFDCSTSSLSNELDVKVYPNPVFQTNLLKLSVNLPKQQVVSIEVFDVKGQLVQAIPSKLFSKGTQIIQVFEGYSNMTPGVYIIKVKTDDTFKQIKFIQQ